MIDIGQNYAMIRSTINQHARNVGRNPDQIALIAVTKTVGLPEIVQAIECGLTNFGESRVKDALIKQDQLKIKQATPVNWHYIGHLQTNKVKNVIGRFSFIHSVDSVRCARAIQTEAQKSGCRQKILLEVNISAEQAKYGFKPDDLENGLEDILGLTALEICGLMTMAPFTEDMGLVRSCFKGLKELQSSLQAIYGPDLNLEHLSMGMTHDYGIAVEEGATMVRIGTALFHQT
ncbi:YggS family pyridoxal phosphate-dependent enzyme [bacterium]|nr:YggS family pyridoxal phosphate-dependent enzyme [bacterium]